MSKIKICGLRRLEDAFIVNEGQPDFAGFILTPSKRQVTIIQAEAISKALSPSIARVGVFAKETPGEIAEAAIILELDGIQLHFDTPPGFLDELKNLLSRFRFKRTPFLWQRIPVSAASVPRSDNKSETGSESGSGTASGTDLSERLASFADLSLFDGLLLDTVHEGQDGGTGMTFPWQPAMDFIKNNRLDTSRIIVAGGLTVENVAGAISFFNPFAVDVSSGVETNGYKDREKVLRFLETARKAKV
ncbi:MAG: phosphoribosylanthranilate isomerase [Eubacteriales bacterium]